MRHVYRAIFHHFNVLKFHPPQLTYRIYHIFLFSSQIFIEESLRDFFIVAPLYSHFNRSHDVFTSSQLPCCCPCLALSPSAENCVGRNRCTRLEPENTRFNSRKELLRPSLSCLARPETLLLLLSAPLLLFTWVAADDRTW